MTPINQISYGKENVRLLTTHILPEESSAPGLQRKTVSEFIVRVLLGGTSFESSFSVADNKLVVATDTIKNTIYALAKTTKNPAMDSPEIFACEIGEHFIGTYSHVDTVDVYIEELDWTRIPVTTLSPVTNTETGSAINKNNTGARPIAKHPHSYVRNSTAKRLVRLIYRKDGSFELKSGLKGLLVLKTTGSSFEDFHVSKYRSLPNMTDRILSTDVDFSYEIKSLKLKKERYNEIFNANKQIILDLFANHNSPSVQNTLYRMADVMLATFEDIDNIHFSLPNKHSFAYDLDRFGLSNKGTSTTVLAPQTDPSGLITATISRKSKPLIKHYVPTL